MHPAGVIYGASYADVLRPAAGRRLRSPVCRCSARSLALLHAFTRRNWPIPVAIALYLIVSIGGEAYSTLLQRFVVTPNEQARESPFIQHNIDATRARVRARSRRRARADRRRHAHARRHHAQRDDARRTFGSGIISRCSTPSASCRRSAPTTTSCRSTTTATCINGRPQQVMLSARELNSNSLPNRTWVNERLTFTHGYGLTLGPVNQVTSEGLPVLFVRNLPTETIPDLPIARSPACYFGELSNDYVIVRTRTREFHYPARRRERLHAVRGQRRPRARVALDAGSCSRCGSARTRSRSTTTSPARAASCSTATSRERVARDRAVPRPSIATRTSVLADGRLYWMYDAYTTSEPLSVCHAGARGQLHPQLGEDRHRRLQRHDDVLCRRCDGSDRSRPTRACSPACSSRSPRCPQHCARTSAIPRTSSRCRPRSSRPIT